jgi:hypothetical protein
VRVTVEVGSAVLPDVGKLGRTVGGEVERERCSTPGGRASEELSEGTRSG